VLTRFAYQIHLTLERRFPEQRLFLKSDTETRFIRLRPATQAIAVVVGGIALAWTILATAILLFDSISAGSSREQVLRQQALYEERMNTLSMDRDLRAEEAASAQARFNLALEQVATMQSRLLASEDRRRELETGIDVIQNTLRRTILERDEARAELSRASLTENPDGATTEAGRAQDTEDTLEFLASSLDGTARERDRIQGMADKATEQIAQIADEKRQIELRNEAIFTRLEEALTVSVEPLEKMFNAAGMDPDDLLEAVRTGYDGQGGPLAPLSLSTKGVPSIEETRANAILAGLDRMNLYRLAAFKAPFDNPVKGAYRFTSGFGARQDPKGWGTRMHAGTDFAASYGTPIHVTADGVVTFVGWSSGYGRLIKVQHAFGIETRYAHLAQMRVSVGQKVSRGERIGDMGNSGRSTGTHLHYEVRIGGNAVNPMTFIKAATHVF
jgi:murein DD-endopeptidase MepM/ murein hydrolase activator NlpD